MEISLEKMYEGICRFRELHFKKDKDYFRKLSDGQSPEVLLIRCIDPHTVLNELSEMCLMRINIIY